MRSALVTAALEPARLLAEVSDPSNGDASVAIAVAHPRRAAAYEASRFIIEELKTRVPIWKREHYADGSREWVDPTRAALDPRAVARLVASDGADSAQAAR